jgi:dTDP-4-dehydrorhamnose reductase
MTSESAVELVVGADGMIGSALLRGLGSAGRRVLGTSRRREASAGMRFLDLYDPPRIWDGPPVRVAYLCAGMSGLDACRRDPVTSTRVNVDSTCRLAKALAAAGAFVVYLSTNHVFDGSAPYRRPDESTCPVTEYGRQKAAAERGILELGESAAVVRLTKVFGAKVALFAGWVSALRRGERIRPFEDMRLAPIPVGCVVDMLERLGDQRRSEIYHLSGNRDITYAEAARLIADRLDIDGELIDPVAARAADPSAEPPLRNTTLDMLGVPERLGVVVPDVKETIVAAIAGNRSSFCGGS